MVVAGVSFFVLGAEFGLAVVVRVCLGEQRRRSFLSFGGVFAVLSVRVCVCFFWNWRLPGHAFHSWFLILEVLLVWVSVAAV